MLSLVISRQFKKDIKDLKKKKKNLQDLFIVIDILLRDESLPKEYKTHLLKGKYKGKLECHIESDWLLIYKKTDKYIRCERTGSHIELF